MRSDGELRRLSWGLKQMPLCRRIAQTLAITVLVVSCAATPAEATERYWQAREAQLIVVGCFSQDLTYPWFDGWHVSGTVTVDQLLFGSVAQRNIQYRFTCGWRVCKTWPPPRIADFFELKGIWFLRAADARVWEPPGNGWIDPGVRRIEEQRDFEDYVRRYRSQP